MNAGGFCTSGGCSDMYIVKYDPSGNVLWAKSAGGDNADECGNSVSTDANGNVFVTGYFTSGSIIFGTDTLTNPLYIYNIFVVKYDPWGNVLWAKQQDVGGTNYDYGYSVSTDASGSVFVTSYFYSSSIIFGTDTLINEDSTGNTPDIFLVKYDNNGNILWATSVGGWGNDYGLSVSTDASGNIFVTGHFRSYTIDFGTITLMNAYAGYDDMFIAKLNGATGVNEWSNEESFSVHPNPSSGIFTIQSSEQISAIEIVNLLGEKVYSSQLSNATNNGQLSTNIDLSEAPSGVYFLQLSTDPSTGSGRIARKKIVISH